ncbi:MAG: hypothetical protein AAGU11_19845 [Syntrophobacteraceae bacterium]
MADGPFDRDRIEEGLPWLWQGRFCRLMGHLERRGSIWYRRSPALTSAPSSKSRFRMMPLTLRTDLGGKVGGSSPWQFGAEMDPLRFDLDGRHFRDWSRRGLLTVPHHSRLRKA